MPQLHEESVQPAHDKQVHADDATDNCVVEDIANSVVIAGVVGNYAVAENITNAEGRMAGDCKVNSDYSYLLADCEDCKDYRNQVQQRQVVACSDKDTAEALLEVSKGCFESGVEPVANERLAQAAAALRGGIDSHHGCLTTPTKKLFGGRGFRTHQTSFSVAQACPYPSPQIPFH